MIYSAISTTIFTTAITTGQVRLDITLPFFVDYQQLPRMIAVQYSFSERSTIILRPSDAHSLYIYNLHGLLVLENAETIFHLHTMISLLSFINYRNYAFRIIYTCK